MLEKYKKSEPRIYKQLSKVIEQNLSHAYIFVTNNKELQKQIIFDFVKEIVCPFNKKKCKQCNICSQVDNNNYSELITIESKGMWIKKEQILEIQKKFSKKPIEGKNNVYVIFDAEKMNKQATNSLLKFLEEPSKHIIAILHTENYNLIPLTISSRCHTLFVDDIKEKEEDIISKIKYLYKNKITKEEEIQRDLENTINFILRYEKENIRILNYSKKIFHNNFKDREKINIVLELLMLFYKDVLNLKLNNKIETFIDYADKINIVAKKQETKKIIKKINVILKSKTNIKSGINLNLFFDKFIIELEGVYE